MIPWTEDSMERLMEQFRVKGYGKDKNHVIFMVVGYYAVPVMKKYMIIIKVRPHEDMIIIFLSF